MLLEFFHGAGHAAAKDAVHGQQAQKRVILGDAVQLPLQGEHAGAPVALLQRAARVALGDGLDVVGADDLDVVPVVVFEDAEGVAALVGQRDGAPLLEPRAGDGSAVAVFGVVRVHSACLADVGVEDVVRQAHHHVKHRPPVDIVLVITGGIGDVETVALAGVPLGVDAVERQRDLAVDVGPEGLFRPGRVDFTGRHVGNIAAERDGHVLGTGGGSAQVDRDVFGDDDPAEDFGVTVGGRLRAAAAAPGKQGVGGDDDGLCRDVPVLLRVRDHLGLGQCDLPGEDLHALDADRAPALLKGGQVAHRVGAGGGVVFVQ